MSGSPYSKAQQLGQRKPYRRRVASAKTWARLQDERQGPCLVCGQAPCTLHHVVPRDRFGDDIADNLVPLCGDGTSGCHGLVEAGDAETLRMLAEAIQADEPAVYAYAVEKLGEDGWLRLFKVRFRAA